MKGPATRVVSWLLLLLAVPCLAHALELGNATGVTEPSLVFHPDALNTLRRGQQVDNRMVFSQQVRQSCAGAPLIAGEALVYKPRSGTCGRLSALPPMQQLRLSLAPGFTAGVQHKSLATQQQWQWHLQTAQPLGSCSCPTTPVPLADTDNGDGQSVTTGDLISPILFSAVDVNGQVLAGSFQFRLESDSTFQAGLPSGLSFSCQNPAAGQIECTVMGTATQPGDFLIRFLASNGTFEGESDAGIRVNGIPASISGQLRRDSDSSGVEGALMVLYDANQGAQEVDTVITDASGNYTFDNLVPSDSYVVQVFSLSELGLIAEMYDDIPCPFGCDPANGTLISVTTGQQVTGIDLSVATSGAISGRLTRNDDGTPIVNSVVNSFIVNANGTLSGTGIGFTDLSGDYVINGLPAGNYKVGLQQLYDEGVQNSAMLRSEVYNDQGCPCIWADGDNVAVTLGATTPGINFVLENAPFQVSGRVTDAATGDPIAGVEMQIQDQDIGQLDEPVVVVAGKELTDANGEYTFFVPTGNYVVRTGAAALQYVDEWYDNLPIDIAFDQIPPLVVSASRTGIDFQLDSGSAIQGRVTRSADGTGVSTFLVAADNLDDQRGFAVVTDANGDYNLSGITPGTYRVSTFSGPGFNLINEVYDDIRCAPCEDNGTTVTVTMGATVTGIDFALDTGAGISGSVVADQTDITLPGVLVFFFDSQGTVAGQAFVAGDGRYALQGLPPGGYRVVTTRAGQFSLINEIYDDLPCIGACNVFVGRLLNLQSGDLVQNIDFRLSPVSELGAALPASLDDLGSAVAIGNSRMLVGVPGDDTAGADAGAVQLYSLGSNGGYQLVATLTANDARPGDRFGTAVAIDGALAVIGAPGGGATAKGQTPPLAYVLSIAPDNSTTQIATLSPQNLSNAANSGFATTLAVDGDLIAVGAPQGEKTTADAAGSPSGTNSGTVGLYAVDGDAVTPSVVLTDPNGAAGDEFGTAIAIDEGTIYVGAPNKDGTGGVLAFSAPTPGKLFALPDLIKGLGTLLGDRFGRSLSARKGILAVGAPMHDAAETDAGAVHVFDNTGPVAMEQTKLLPKDPTVASGLAEALLGSINGNFGESVSLGGDTLAIGAVNEDGDAMSSGAAYVFTREEAPQMSMDPPKWTLGDRLVRRDGQSGEQLGKSVAARDGQIAVGAPRGQRSGLDAGVVLGAAAGADVIFSSGFE